MDERLKEIKRKSFAFDQELRQIDMEDQVEWLIQTVEQQQEEIKGCKTLLEGEKDLRKATDELLQEAREEIERLKECYRNSLKDVWSQREEIERLKESRYSQMSDIAKETFGLE